ncbi:hypothetical protein BDN72DRAFT_550073 [Pluteus cervinus]|uniref:Uncharacterized protein n=1 Tax=Pluteus cervinus TaxID=181527 RepID=A0ACD3A5L0_9AGAR|nr:hypothetical protein BDN72DRAFT_550073 [Pluteus cervinus]
MADVPTDILLFIIELVCKEDASTLKTLSLTSVIFRDLCQQRLFKSVRLKNSILVKYNPTIPPLFLSKFHDVVTNSPRIASYIRELKIGQYSMPASGGLRHYRPGVPMLWMIDHSTVISQIFDALESSPIRAFAFTSRRRIGWNELDEHFRVSLSRILRNPSFETISIDGLTIPGHFFADFTSLREVTLLRLDLLPGTVDLPPSTRTHLISHLTFSLNLQYDLDGAELPKIKCLGPIIGLDLSSIEVLDVELNFGLVPELSRHLLHLRTLRYLKLSTHPYGE